MSDLTTNKILAAVLAMALVIVGLNAVIPEFFQKTPPAKPGYAVAVAADTSGGGEAADVPPDWGTVLKTADFAPAFIAAEKSGLPSVIHVKFDAEGITPTTTLSAIREKALKA
jgi:hypothetical protein